MDTPKTTFRQCKICGAPALFIHFGVISCSSCKMFFKRRAEIDKGRLKCDFIGQCEIDIDTRRLCSSCRLAKCFASGMKIELIRFSRARKNTRKKKNEVMIGLTISTALAKRNGTNGTQQLPTLSLLRSDQSKLSANQWNLLSNLIHCYDEYGALPMAYRFISEQNALPVKLRFKHSIVGEFVTSNMIGTQRIFQKNNDFLSLCSIDRSTLLQNTVKHTGCIGGTFVLHQAKLLDDPRFFESSEAIFGSNIMSIIKPLINSFDSDIIFVKLVHTIMTFSTTNYAIYSNTPPINLSEITTIIRIQDTYTELTWRYLVYKYTYEQAVKCFCNLVRFLSLVNFTIVEVDKIQAYTKMIDTVIEQTEKILTLNN